MRRFRRAAVATLIGLAALGVTVWSQNSPLAVVSALPVGVLADVADGRDIRVVFSEPMVALGAPATDRRRGLRSCRRCADRFTGRARRS